MGMDKPIVKKKWPARRLILYGILALAAIINIFLLKFADHPCDFNIDTDRVVISTVEKGIFNEYIPIVGSIVPQNSIEINSLESGIISSVHVPSQSFVKKGEKIFTLSNTTIWMTLTTNQTQVKMFKEELKSMEGQLEKAKRAVTLEQIETEREYKVIHDKYEYMKCLFSEGLISSYDFEDYKSLYDLILKKKSISREVREKQLNFLVTQVNNLKISIAKMEQMLELVKEQYNRLTICAPVSGQLILEVQKGRVVHQGELVALIERKENWYIRSSVSSEIVKYIFPGKVCYYDSQEKSYTLKVKKVGKIQPYRKQEIEFEFIDPIPSELVKRQVIFIQLPLSPPVTALLLTRGGFYNSTGGSWVYVIDKSGKCAVKRSVRFGRKNPRYFEVLEGLQHGEEVITSQYDDFYDKDRLMLK